MTPEQLRELLEILRDSGVTRYKTGDLELDLVVVLPPAEQTRPAEEPQPATRYHDKRLFPHGPPKFPGSE